MAASSIISHLSTAPRHRQQLGNWLFVATQTSHCWPLAALQGTAAELTLCACGLMTVCSHGRPAKPTLCGSQTMTVCSQGRPVKPSLCGSQTMTVRDLHAITQNTPRQNKQHMVPDNACCSSAHHTCQQAARIYNEHHDNMQTCSHVLATGRCRCTTTYCTDQRAIDGSGRL